MRRFKLALTALALLICLAPAVSVAAAGYNPFATVCSQAQNPSSSPVCTADGSDPITGKNGILYKTSRILALVAGVAAVIIVMIGGFMYVTASGDANRAKNGRSMIIGAAIGLVIIALAELIITIIINLVS